MMFLLRRSEDWVRGFEAGIAYALMLQQCPLISGIYSSQSEEQLFLFAHQLGYTFRWKPLSDGKSAIEFTYAGDRLYGQVGQDDR